MPWFTVGLDTVFHVPRKVLVEHSPGSASLQCRDHFRDSPAADVRWPKHRDRPIVLLDDGEIVASLRVFDFTMLVNGAPIKWKALNPTFGRPNAVAVAKRAQRPHAALLFVDFMLSLEGQELMKKRNRVPASPKVDTKLNDFPYEMIDPVIVLDEAEKWEKIWSELFLKGAAIQREKD